jgi:hypothetical protein
MVHEVAAREVVRLPGEGVAVTDTVVRRAALLRRVSWGGILAGTGIALAMQLLFSTLGAGIGLAVIDPADSTRAMAIGAGIWWLVTGLVSLFIGGMVAGRLAGFPQRVEAALHGVMVWSLTAIIGVMVLSTSAATFLGGAVGPMARSYSRDQANRVASGLSAVGNEAMHQLNRLGQPAPQPDETAAPKAPAELAPPTASTGPIDRPAMAEYESRRAAPTLGAAALWSFFALLLAPARRASAASAGARRWV